jgi:hypothetical protein
MAMLIPESVSKLLNERSRCVYNVILPQIHIISEQLNASISTMHFFHSLLISLVVFQKSATMDAFMLSGKFGVGGLLAL